MFKTAFTFLKSHFEETCQPSMILVNHRQNPLYKCENNERYIYFKTQLFMVPQNLAYQESPSSNAKQNLKMVLSNQYGHIQAKTNR